MDEWVSSCLKSLKNYPFSGSGRQTTRFLSSLPHPDSRVKLDGLVKIALGVSVISTHLPVIQTDLPVISTAGKNLILSARYAIKISLCKRQIEMAGWRELFRSRLI
ncbi:MAG: hypothetical protein DRH43_03715 [Deltaproteobacteria bacterium]|nr:MAG: hypothetical protein DRH43_03715 [Deltaproteobacteria bacterium]